MASLQGGGAPGNERPENEWRNVHDFLNEAQNQAIELADAVAAAGAPYRQIGTAFLALMLALHHAGVAVDALLPMVWRPRSG